jgi:hypothetical protein
MGTTTHFEIRRLERRIPRDAHRVVSTHGRQFRGRRGERIHFLDSLAAWSAQQQGLDLYRYVGIVVVEGANHVAVTCYWLDEDTARRRWEVEA